MLPINLKILAQNPYDVTALTQAGIGALAVGDPQAAIGFLARAEELSPRDWRIKAALGTALIQVEKPNEALRLFAEASSLGVPDREIAKERGLAYDLYGDPKRAQKDYALALKYSGDDELTRRYAMSLGISGDKDKAIEQLEPLTRRGDQAAWRAKAFVYAMNGDQAQADKIARATAPSLVSIMIPFFRRLPTLNYGERARAVNFGTMPSGAAPITPVYANLENSGAFRSVGNGSTDGLVGRTQVAAAKTETPEFSKSQLKQIAKREKELAKLAARGQQAAGLPPAGASTTVSTPTKVAVATPPPPPKFEPPQPQSGGPLGERVGKRIGPVDPSRYPDFARPDPPLPAGASAAPFPAKPSAVQVSVLPGVTSLPRPDAALPAQVAVAVKPAPLPVPAAKPPTVFTQPQPVLPTPVVAPPQSVTPPVVPAVPPVKIAATTPPAVLSTPVITPPKVETSTVVTTPPPVKVAVATPPPVLPATVIEAPKPVSPEPVIKLPSTAPVTPTPAIAAPSAVAASLGAVLETPKPILPASAPTLATSPLIKTVDLPASQAPTAKPFESGITPPLPNVVKATDAPVTVPGFSAPLSAPAEGAVVAKETPKPGFSDVPSLTPDPALSGPILPPASPTPVETVVAPVVTTPPPAEAPAARLASVIDGIEPEQESAAVALPSLAEQRAKKLAALRKTEAAEKLRLKTETDAAAKKQEEQRAAEQAEAEKAAELKRNPARLWVQIATGANRSGLPITWRKLTADAPNALGKMSGWYAPFKSTNRLLVGPVKSPTAARTLVSALAKEGVQANTYASEAGLEVFKLGAR